MSDFDAPPDPVAAFRALLLRGGDREGRRRGGEGVGKEEGSLGPQNSLQIDVPADYARSLIPYILTRSILKRIRLLMLNIIVFER